MSSILIVEDDIIIRTALRKLLERSQYTVSEVASVNEAKESLNHSPFDLIISELHLPTAPGTDLITATDDTPVLIMTNHASLRSAVDSMRMGAVDYIAKPFDHDDITQAIKRAIGKASKAAKQRPKSKTPNHQANGMVGSSKVMKDLYNRIHKVAPTRASVLVYGETGTGKELAANAIHSESPRAEYPIISVNCAAIPDTLIESELFGHEKGAFTGAATTRDGLIAAADGGTLFLDEIGELPLEAQARLLRVLQEGEVRPIGAIESRKVDIRLVAATHRDLHKLCQEKRFREDLYFRINVVKLTLPPLRDRGKDIITLAENLLERFCQEMDKNTLHLTPQAIQVITTYTWPGNVRELENAIQRAVILCENDQEINHQLLDIDVDLIERYNQERPSQQDIRPSPQIVERNEPEENLSLEDYFQRFVMEHQDSMSETELARKLGVSRKCLWERRQRLGIPRNKNSVK